VLSFFRNRGVQNGQAAGRRTRAHRCQHRGRVCGHVGTARADGVKNKSGFVVGLDLNTVRKQLTAARAFKGLKRFRGDKERLGCSVLQQASNGIVKTSSYIRLLALLMLGNVFPRESVGRIVRLNLPRDPGHHCHHLNPGYAKT
jgi:hypothetical protein